MIARRSFILSALGVVILPCRTSAQPTRAWRIGFLGPSSPKENAPFFDALREGLERLGYTEGQNLIIERASANGRLEALPSLAADLVRAKVDLIFAGSTPAALAAKSATPSIPIVFASVSDPVGSGLVANLSRPGGNVTGVTDSGVDVTAKRFDLLKQLVPTLQRVAVLGDSTDSLWEPIWKEVQLAARHLRIEIVLLVASNPSRLEIELQDLSRRVDALFVAPQPVFWVHRRTIIDQAQRVGLPAIYEFRSYVDAGGLMSYGPNYLAQYRNAARLVDKILKGAKPADLPVEEPTQYELAINMKAAEALRLQISSSVLQRADVVIQ